MVLAASYALPLKPLRAGSIGYNDVLGRAEVRARAVGEI